MKPTDEDVAVSVDAYMDHPGKLVAEGIRAALEAYTPRLIERQAREAENMDWIAYRYINKRTGEVVERPLADLIRSHLEKNHD